MAEITGRNGSWTFDGETLRVVPGLGRGVHPLRSSLGEVAVPLAAIAGVSFEQGRRGRRGGRLRLRLRDGADPLTRVVEGRLPDQADPYQLAVDTDRSGAAEYLVDEVRHALLWEEAPDTPCDRYLVPGPSVPRTASGTDGTASFDGERVRLEWNWMAESSKSAGGPRQFALSELAGVEWRPASGWASGGLRFLPNGPRTHAKPEHDPNCLLLWGVRQSRETGGSVLLAAAVQARLPHPSAGAAEPRPAARPALTDGPGDVDPAPDPRPETASDHDALLRRLRELEELRRVGVLTEEEFHTAKKAVLARF